VSVAWRRLGQAKSLEICKILTKLLNHKISFTERKISDIVCQHFG